MAEIVVQRACADPGQPDDGAILRWAGAALGERDGELVVRVVDQLESQALNLRYRGKDRPTNVLSFPAEEIPGIPDAPLGDIVICDPVVREEAKHQGKALDAHWAHMVVHGTLHILGYDHTTPAEAEDMESLEREILTSFGFPDPYNSDD